MRSFRGGPRPKALEAAGLVAWLVLVWLALWGEPSWVNLVSGLVIGSAIVAAFPLSRGVRARVSVVALVRFAFAFVVALVVSTLEVLVLAVKPSPELRQGIIAVPLTASSPVSIAFIANTLSLTPGTLTVDLDETRSTLFVHALRFDSPEEIRQKVHRLERLVLDAIGSEAERTALAAIDRGRSTRSPGQEST
jgi:multicomponent Na+:H+ antiporter subunit E